MFAECRDTRFTTLAIPAVATSPPAQEHVMLSRTLAAAYNLTTHP